METLVGRSRELQVAAAGLERARARSGATLLVEGEAGVGKSRLVERVVGAARAVGMTTFVGAAHPLERTRAFGALADAIGLRRSSDPVRARIRTWLEGDPGSGAGGAPDAGPDVRFRVVEAMLDLLESAPTATPTVLALEDLHWADGSTLIALQRIARDLADVPLLVTASMLPSPLSPELAAVLDEVIGAGAVTIALHPMGDSEVKSLVELETGCRPAPALATLVGHAGGDPLWVVEMLRSLDADGWLERREGPTLP